MKRTIITFLLVASAIAFCMPVFASVPPEYGDLIDDIGASELTEYLPDETVEELDESGVKIDDIDIDITKILEHIFSTAKNESTQPIRTGTVLLGAIMLASLAGGFKNALSDSRTANTVCTAVSVFCAVTVTAPLLRFFTATAKAIETANTFEKCFIPVFAAVLISAGQNASAIGSAAGILTASELSASVLTKAVLPFSRVLAGISACACALGSSMEAILSEIEKGIKWTLGLISSILVGALTISGIAASGVDSVAGKTMKFVVSGTVPVIGGSLSEALSSVKSCIGLLRNSVGAFGIVACAYIFLPVIIQGAEWNLVLSLCSGAAGMLCAENISKLLKSFSGIVSLVLSACILMMLVLIVSASMIVIVGKGAA